MAAEVSFSLGVAQTPSALTRRGYCQGANHGQSHPSSVGASSSAGLTGNQLLSGPGSVYTRILLRHWVLSDFPWPFELSKRRISWLENGTVRTPTVVWGSKQFNPG